MAESSLMTLLFGKKRRRRRKSAGGRRRKSSRRSITKKPKGLTKALIKKAQKYKVKVRTKTGYRKLSIIKKEIRRKIKMRERKKRRRSSATNGRRRSSGRKRRRVRRSAFGVGGSYQPLSNFMSPYPYSVDSSPPWI